MFLKLPHYRGVVFILNLCILQFILICFGCFSWDAQLYRSRLCARAGRKELQEGPDKPLIVQQPHCSGAVSI